VTDRQSAVMAVAMFCRLGSGQPSDVDAAAGDDISDIPEVDGIFAADDGEVP